MTITPRLIVLAWIAVWTTGLLAKEPDATRVKSIAGWLPAEPAAIGAPITNRTAWAEFARRPEFADAIEKATALAQHPIPEQPDDLFLDFSRTGNRDHWQTVAFERRAMVWTYLIGEGVENQGRFIPPLEKLIAALCEEKTWVYPAHDRSLKNFRRQEVDIDLGSSAVGWSLATTRNILGDKLSSATQRLIRENLDRRIFTPFRDSIRETRGGNWWIKGDNNWNAVCLAGVNGAALATLESREERAWFIVAAEDSVQNFLNGFTPDGYCSEGVGYWNYGFGHYLLLSETIRRATDGHVDFLSNPKAVRPALFGARTEIAADIYPSIADCSPGSRPSLALMTFLTNRFDFDLPPSQSAAGKVTRSVNESFLLSDASSRLPKISARSELDDLPWRTWFPQGGVLICRPGTNQPSPFAVCLKGGNNAENHNHNDVGTFMVVSGKTMLICDPGSEVYTSRTFSAKRYESKVLNSFGHAVPVIAGKLQREGADARGVVLETKFTPTQDTLRLDIRSAYAVPELKKLERAFIYQRGPAPSLTVTDSIQFSKPSTYEAALITWGQWKRSSDNELLISDGSDAVRVQIDSGNIPFEVASEVLDEHVHTKTKPVRIGLKLSQPITHGEFKLTIQPAKNN
ncbi:MAG: hypothetical protein RLY20_2992 [Verrucomicrobiota bacterium]